MKTGGLRLILVPCAASSAQSERSLHVANPYLIEPCFSSLSWLRARLRALLSFSLLASETGPPAKLCLPPRNLRKTPTDQSGRRLNERTRLRTFVFSPDSLVPLFDVLILVVRRLLAAASVNITCLGLPDSRGIPSTKSNVLHRYRIPGRRHSSWSRSA